MHRTPFDDGWQFVARKPSLFDTLSGGPPSVPVTLPHDAVLGGGRSAEGSDGSHTGYFRSGAWQYEKTFDVPEDWSTRRVTLEFEGVYRDAMVYLNGAFAGQWANGYSTFHIAADPFLRYGEPNTVRVEAQAHRDSRWYSGGGIHRPVHLLVGDLVHVTPTGLRVTTPQIDDELAVAAVATEIANESTATRTVEVLVQIRDPRGAVVATDRAPATLLAGDRLIVRQRAYVPRPERWSTRTPALYTVQVQVTEDGRVLDEAAAPLGFRTLALDPVHGLRVNGEQVKLRGACVHHDNGILGSAAFAQAEARRVRLLKAAGFNAIRSAHNPMSTAMLDACDRLGMIVMDETFDMWAVSKTDDDYSRRFPQWWQRDVDALVAKDVNHPSVVFYSIGNEILEVGSPHGARTGRAIAERVRDQDPTRFLTNAINGAIAVTDQMAELLAGSGDGQGDGGFNDALSTGTMMSDLVTRPEVGERIAESAALLDVLGLNYGDVRYLPDRLEHPNRVVVGSETFPTQIDHLWRLVSEHGHVIGDFTWTGWDYLGEAGIGRPRYPDDTAFAAAYPGLTAGCGDIDLTGRRRPVSYYREIVFGLRDRPYLAAQRPERRDAPAPASGWSWTDAVASWTWGVPVGTPVTVEVYADAEEVVLLLDGAPVAQARVGETRAHLATADVPYRPGTLEAVAYRGGVETGRTALRTATGPARLRVAPDGDGATGDGTGGTGDRGTAPGSDDALVLVDIDLVDEAGTGYPTADRPVTVSVTGPARLVGLGTARPSTEESFLADTCTTYQGHALAAVLCTGEEGVVEVTVSAAGLDAVTVPLGQLLPA